MDKRIENFKNLFSENKKVIYNALMEKKDAINGVFYTTCSFQGLVKDDKKIYPELFSILSNALFFELKDDKYGYKYFNMYPKYEEKEGFFLLKYAFNELDRYTYLDLFANFYPCFKEKEYKFEDPIQNELYELMISNDEYVLILDKSKLINQSYPLKVLKEIIYDSKYIDEEKLATLKEIATSLNINLREINNG